MMNDAEKPMFFANPTIFTVYRSIVVFLITALLYKLVCKPHKRQSFPAWSTIEIAVTGILIRKGGLSKRL